MARTKRLKKKIIKMLNDRGEMNTVEIYNEINDAFGKYGMKYGTQMHQLVNVLGKEPDFKIVWHHTDDNSPIVLRAMDSSQYRVCSWRLARSIPA